jgi:hypothetical protein
MKPSNRYEVSFKVDVSRRLPSVSSAAKCRILWYIAFLLEARC